MRAPVVFGLEASTDGARRASLSGPLHIARWLRSLSELEAAAFESPPDLILLCGAEAQAAVELLAGLVPTVVVGAAWEDRLDDWAALGVLDVVADPECPVGHARLAVAARRAAGVRSSSRVSAARRLLRSATAGGLRATLERELGALGVGRWQLYAPAGDAWALHAGRWDGEGAWSGAVEGGVHPALGTLTRGAATAVPESPERVLLACRLRGELVGVLRLEAHTDVEDVADLVAAACGVALASASPPMSAGRAEDNARLVHAMRGHLGVVLAETQLLELSPELSASAQSQLRTIGSRIARLGVLVDSLVHDEQSVGEI